jgi:hypothetical protein
MARREGLYEVDGELVSERTPPVRWRALSYTQPMSERAPGRGKGKLMRVMFDSNATRFAPLRRARDKSARSKHASCKIAPMRFAIDESVRRDPQPDVGDPRARTAAVSRCHRCTICCDSGRPADQCGNDTDVAGSRGDLGMRRSCPTKQSRRHRSAGTPRVSPSFFFRVPEKTAGHQRVAFPIDS